MVTFSPLTITYRFVRRVAHVAAGLTYTPQFTADGVSFLDSGDLPTVVVADDGTGYEVVEVPFMVFLPNGTKASAALARHASAVSVRCIRVRRCSSIAAGRARNARAEAQRQRPGRALPGPLPPTAQPARARAVASSSAATAATASPT